MRRKNQSDQQPQPQPQQPAQMTPEQIFFWQQQQQQQIAAQPMIDPNAQQPVWPQWQGGAQQPPPYDPNNPAAWQLWQQQNAQYPQPDPSQQAALWQQQQQPPTAATKPKKKKKTQKRRAPSALGRIFRLILVLAIVAGVIVFAVNMLRGSAPTTATIESGVLGTTYSGDALIVRNETAFDDEGVMMIEYEAEEGSMVQRGGVVCYVYSTGYTSKEQATLQSYRDQIKVYQQTLLKAETAFDQKMERLGNEVITRGLEVRALVQGARGNLINQETILSEAITQRQDYFRSKYSDNISLGRLYDEETTQLQRIDSWVKQVAANQDSIISFYTDGFEYALTPDKYSAYSPAEVRSMIAGNRPEQSVSARGKTNIYRLVSPNNYVVLLLIKDSKWNPIEGSTYKLVMEQFSDTVVEARVLSFTRSGGELLVRLAVMGDVRPVLYMRTCRAELGEYVDTLLVPSAALYQYEGATGVVLVTGDAERPQVFVPVNIVSTKGGNAYISPVQTGVLTTGQTVRLFH